VGSGITLDAEPQPELAEWRAKTRFLERARAPVDALETMRLEAGRYPHGSSHLARMARCARHFALPFDGTALEARLQATAEQHAQGLWRVRLTLDALGQIAVQCEPLADIAGPVQLALAPSPIATRGPLAEFIQYKTTRREVYEAFAKPAGCWDVVLFNEDGELTEASFGNIALKLDGQWLTPRREAGLLPGIGREQSLREGRVREARLMQSDWRQASEIAWFNALRGWKRACGV
jgi:para-aminobenzoate synthetase/4-amino-4-deoxychorismate lyase